MAVQELSIKEPAARVATASADELQDLQGTGWSSTWVPRTLPRTACCDW